MICAIQGGEDKRAAGAFFLDKVTDAKKKRVRKMSIEEVRQAALAKGGIDASPTSLIDRLTGAVPDDKLIGLSTEEKLDRIGNGFEAMQSSLLRRQSMLRETFHAMERKLDEVEGEIHKLGPRLRNREQSQIYDRGWVSLACFGKLWRAENCEHL